MQFEFLIPSRPVSLQTRNRSNLQAWKQFVYGEAAKLWTGASSSNINIHLTLVYLCDEDPVDSDNIIKPIQDALIGLIYDDDSLITDVEVHRRLITGIFDIARLPPLILEGVNSHQECVYVRVLLATPLEEYFDKVRNEQ